MSIKLKVILSVVVVLILGMILQLYQLQVNSKANLGLISQQSLDTARSSFDHLEQNDIRMLEAVGEVFKTRSDLLAAYKARDRKKLYELATPIYKELKSKYGITHWNFIDAPPQNVVFARMSKPELVGDTVKRATFMNAVQTGKLGVGKEVGKTGFVLRTVTPILAGDQIIGYQEIGEDIDRFFSFIKKQTGSDVALAMDKKLLNQADWESTCKAKNQRNNWDDYPDIVLVSNTASDGTLLGDSLKSALSLPPEGKVLGLTEAAGRSTQQSAFPVKDASGKVAGSVLLHQDVTHYTAAMKLNSTKMIVAIVLQAVVLCLLLSLLLYRLVFARLNQMIEKVTRVVGGDTSVTSEENDEVGRFESQVIGILKSVLSTMQ